MSPLAIDDMHINKLCVQESGKSWKYPSLEATDPLKPLLIPCAIMTSAELKNDIFHQQCKDHVKQLNSTDTFAQIADAIEAAFESCNLLLAKVKDQTISLHEVDTVFRHKSYSVITLALGHLEIALFSKVSISFLEAAEAFSIQKPPCSVSSIFMKSMKTTPAPWVNEVATNVTLWRGLSPLLVEAEDFADILCDFEVEPDEFIAFSKMVSIIYLHF